FFFQAEDGTRDFHVTGVQTCALPICFIDEQPRFIQQLAEDLFESRYIIRMNIIKNTMPGPFLTGVTKDFLYGWRRIDDYTVGIEFGRASCRDRVELGADRRTIRRTEK